MAKAKGNARVQNAEPAGLWHQPALMNLLDWQGGSVSGSVLFRDRDLLAMSRRELRELRGADISLVLQSASAALNPALRLESHFREAWSAHSDVPWREKRALPERGSGRPSVPFNRSPLLSY